MKNLILTTVLSLTIFSGLQAQETYYEKHVAFPAGATAAEKVEMASRLVPTPQQLEMAAYGTDRFPAFRCKYFHRTRVGRWY